MKYINNLIGFLLELHFWVILFYFSKKKKIDFKLLNHKYIILMKNKIKIVVLGAG